MYLPTRYARWHRDDARRPCYEVAYLQCMKPGAPLGLPAEKWVRRAFVILTDRLLRAPLDSCLSGHVSDPPI